MENVTLVNATTDFLKSEILKKDERIQALEESHSRLSSREVSHMANISNVRNEMQEWTLEQLSDGGLTSSQAEEISNIVGFELTKEVEAIVTVEYSITLQVPYDVEAADVINDIDFETVSYNDEHISWLSSEVTNIDI